MSSSPLRFAGAAAAVALFAAGAQAQGPSTGGLVAPTTGGDELARTGYSSDRPTPAWTQWSPKPSIALSSLPYQYMGASRIPGYSEDQYGSSQCAGGWNQQSKCQVAWINSLEDFCVWGPPEPGTVGATERRAVAYCTKEGHGTRLIPDGSIFGAHFVRTPDYVQVTGVGDFTSIGIPLGDDGGEMDSAGMDDLSNPIGGIVYTTAKPGSNGQPVFATEWTNFMSWNQFCFRACFGNNPERHCEHVYDTLGCGFNIPANYSADVFETCDGDNAMFQGRYVQADGSTSTFRNGDPVTPQPHPAPSSSNCRNSASLANRLIAARPSGAPESSATSAPASASTGTRPAGAATGSGSGTGTARPTGSAVNNAAGSSSTGSNAASGKATAAVGIAGTAAFAALAAVLLA